MTQKTETLPKWAQDTMARLERRVAQLEAERGKKAEDASACWSEDLTAWYALPEWCIVQFVLRDESGHKARVAVQMRDGELTLRTTDHRLLIIPQYSNVVEVRAESYAKEKPAT